MTAQRRIGVLGGSFNPPHVGHLMIASDAWAELGLQQVLFVPAGAPPHKRVAGDVPAAWRLEMTRLAVEGDARFAVSPVEIDEGLRYTVDTLAAVRRESGEAEVVFILGSDSLLEFRSWHRAEAILGQCRLAVALRPDDDLERVTAEARAYGAGKVSLLANTRVAVSSSDVRARVLRGAPIRYLVPAAVERFIVEHGLYAS
jgi:nicotinate-nucleotide adenylyltransferase